jgi:hypothetical protein
LASGLRRPVPPEAMAIVAAAGSIAGISLIFGSPLIAAILLLEVAGLGRERIPLVLLPGLLAAGVGSLVYLGLGSRSGLSTSAYSVERLRLPDYARPSVTDFLWTIPLAVAVALGALAMVVLPRRLHGVVASRTLVLVPAAGLVVAGLAIAFSELTDRSADEVLLLRAGDPARAGVERGRVVGGRALRPDRLQGARLVDLAGVLPRRADLPGDAAGLGRGHPGLPPPRDRADPRGRRWPRRRGRGDGAAAAHCGPAGGDPHRLVGVGSSPLIVVGVVAAFLTVHLLDREDPAHWPTGP